MSTTPTILLYGANGYTGRLMLDEAVRRGLNVIVAGRSAAPIEALAARYGLASRVFDLNDASALDAALEDVSVIALAAGPFSQTSRRVVDACLRTQTHYVDITGELEVFEACFQRTAEAASRGVVLLPGAGFDVVPTDCMAATLAAALPDATHLELAFAGGAGSSRGTTLTMIEGLPNGGAERVDGRIVTTPAASRSRTVAFRDKPRHVVSIPWGDVSTAYYSTGIPNIVTYMALPKGPARGLRMLGKAGPLLGAAPVQRALKELVGRTMDGPDDAARARARSQVWGLATNAAGKRVEGTLVAPEGYTLTARTSIDAARRLATEAIAPGTKTPSMAFGAGFMGSFDGCDLRAPGAA